MNRFSFVLVLVIVVLLGVSAYNNGAFSQVQIAYGTIQQNHQGSAQSLVSFDLTESNCYWRRLCDLTLHGNEELKILFLAKGYKMTKVCYPGDTWGYCNYLFEKK